MTVGDATGEPRVVMWISLWPKEKTPHVLGREAGQSKQNISGVFIVFVDKMDDMTIRH